MNAKWRKLKLKDICRNITESEKKPLESGLKYFIGLEHIEPENLNINSWGLISEGTTFTRKFKKGQVLFGKRRAYQKKAALAEFDGVCSSDILVFEGKEEKIIPELLPYIIQNDDFFNYAVETSYGSLSPRTKWKHLAEYEVDIPNKGVQEDILKTLLAIEKVINTSENQLHKTEKYKEKLIEKLLKRGIRKTDSNETTIEELPNNWNIVKIGEICEVKTGGTPRKSHPEYWNGNIKWMASGDIHLGRVKDVEGRITELGLAKSNAQLLPENTVMIALNGQGKTRGTVAILEVELSCNQSLAGFLPSENYISEFLYYNLQSRYHELRNLTGDAGRTGLNLGILRNLKIALPAIKEQQEIVEIIKEIDNTIDDIQRHMSITKEFKKSMIKKLFDPRFYQGNIEKV